jgi:hypothetical protein
MTVHVRVFVAAWRGATRLVRVCVIARTGSAEIISEASARRRTFIPVASIIEVTRRRSATAVVITARTVAARGAATFIVIVIRCGWIATAAHRRARAVPVTAAIIWSTWPTTERCARLERRRWGRVGYILGALNLLSLELAAVELLDGCLEIGGRLVLDESAWVRIEACAVWR